MTLLNKGDYWNRTGTYSTTGLTSDAKLMVGNAKWYLGGTNQYTTTSAIQFYSYERGTTVYSGRPTSWVGKVGLMYPSDYGYATSGETTTNRDACLSKELWNWSDSSVNDCKNSDWLLDRSNHQWKLTPRSDNYNSAFVVDGSGRMGTSFVKDFYAFLPTVFLKANIEITGGTGIESDPYRLTLPPPDPPKTTADFANLVGYGGLVEEPHPATSQLVTTTAYRYTGATPDNYVWFNNELWRIIGVFETDNGVGKLEQRMKIIRNESIGIMKWDTKETYGVNDWSKATGMELLNSGDYYNRTDSYASTGLTEEAKTMIDNAKWYLGGTNQYTTTSAIQFYSYERGTTVYTGRPTSWVGKVAFMYPSDYGYATNGGSTTNRTTCLATELYNWNDSSYSDCKDNDWLLNSKNWQWTLAPGSDNSSGIFYVTSTGQVIHVLSSNGTGAFRPSVYLKSDIAITRGTGTKSDPYQLSL